MNFEQFLQQKKMIALTISRHQREVSKFEKWLETKGKIVETTEKKDLLNYLQHLKQSRNLNNATLSSLLGILKNYYNYLAKEHDIKDITHFIKIRGTKRKHLPQIFTPEELEQLCDVYYYHTQEYKPNKKELYHYPDQQKLLQGRYIALTLIVYQALQIHEILTLTQSDFDLRKATITIRASRRGAERKLQLDASQVGVLMQYYSDNEDSPFIPNLNQFERISKTLKKLQPKFKDFKQIRTSKITHWLKLHGLRKTQYLAGHKNIKTTESYFAGDFETLQNDFDNYHPLN